MYPLFKTFAKTLAFAYRMEDLRLLPIGVMLAMLVIGSSVARADAIAHWTFNESGGTTANDSVGSFDGVLQGGATFVPGGISGNAISLTEATNSLVNVGVGFPGFTSGNFSIVAWIMTTTTANDTFVVGKHEAGTLNGYLLGLNQTGPGYGRPNNAFFYASAPPGREALSTAIVNNGVWHQLVGVFSGGTARFYVDGSLGETESGRSINSNGAAFLIGGINVGGNPTATYTGLVDEVQVYNHALTQSEINFLFQNPGQTLPVPEPSAMLLLGTGLAGIATRIRKRRKARDREP